MTPYNAAWAAGPHAQTRCVSCHVDPGVIADFAHKFVALKEVWVHFTGDPKFPQDAAEVSNARCLRCHDDKIDPGIKGFDHEMHRDGHACMTCHDTTGHDVTAASLEAAGILNADVQALNAGRNQAPTDKGAPLEGHKAVVCSQCHDMPASTCIACHEAPKGHFQRPCLTCHAPATWAFTHPDANAMCALCHERPAGHRDGECSACHGIGASWAFVHPLSTACAACHAPPANHYAGSCAACHTPKTPFDETVFRHPGQDASCADCHPRPSGHREGQCSACHKAATSWAFVHPASQACANCHPAPANHYGPACANCHSPSQAWKTAVFNHPPIAEHSYRSFPCTDCHPGGFASATCTKCHANGPPRGD